MADPNDSAQEKTEQATPHKLEKSRKEGQVARSKDLATTVSLLVTLLALKFSFPMFYQGLQDLFRIAYVDFSQSEIRPADSAMVIGHGLGILAWLMMPLLVTPLLVIALSLIPGGWVCSSANFMPKLSRLNPISGLGRIVSAQNWTELAKSILKISALTATAVYLLSAAAPSFIALQRGDIYSATAGAMSQAFYIALTLILIFVLFSFIDIPLQRFFFLKKMRMSKQEVKEEQKNREGRPEVKARIKQLQRQLLQRQIARVIKDANVVVVNPEHYAVALRYDTRKAEAPYVIAKGTDEIALYIRELAASHGLEVVEAPPLARAVYFTTQINQQIPAQLYAAVAHVLTYVLQLKAHRAGRRARPVLPSRLPIPESLSRYARS